MALPNIYNSTSGTVMPAGGSNSIPTASGNMNNLYMNQNPGIAAPHYAPLTRSNPNAQAYQDVGGGITFGVATPDEYAQNQLNGMLDSNSRYMQLARQNGINQANSRGMLNSSIAAGNSQASAIQAAAPIAINDANMLANLQATNLKDKTAEDTSTIAAQAQTGAAALAANASMTNTAASLQEAIQQQRERLAYEGEQAGLGRDWASQFAGQQEGYNLTNMQQGYYNQSGLANQQYQYQQGLLNQNYQNQLGYGQFQLGANLLQGQQSGAYQFGLQAMNNPAIMGNPQAFGGFMQFISNPFSMYIDNLFSNLFGSNP